MQFIFTNFCSEPKCSLIFNEGAMRGLDLSMKVLGAWLGLFVRYPHLKLVKEGSTASAFLVCSYFLSHRNGYSDFQVGCLVREGIQGLQSSALRIRF